LNFSIGICISVSPFSGLNLKTGVAAQLSSIVPNTGAKAAIAQAVHEDFMNLRRNKPFKNYNQVQY
jgi:hypothetical protein